jgi:hypothetical protein
MTHLRRSLLLGKVRIGHRARFAQAGRGGIMPLYQRSHRRPRPFAATRSADAARRQDGGGEA